MERVDLQKAREYLSVAEQRIARGFPQDYVEAVADIFGAVKAIIDALDPFDWQNVKPGMAFFFDGNPEVVRWFLSASFENAEWVVMANCQAIASHKDIGVFLKKDLTRAPEHDIEVKV